ncbi:hypothetical protein P9D43_27110 [Neobacillus niacini]|uniref:hypothetical protein n=1 Tax=Neobacillus niacini TaxID=86668 RepID=UPI0007AB9578|nr:hypothetical protein [Neobacillus niacini]MEC1525677.1 hypothetical protein [Neobacillus niacini]
MEFMLTISVIILYLVFFFICLVCFDRYFFQKNIGILSYFYILVYSMFIPMTHTVFFTGSAIIMFNAFYGSVPFSWTVPVLCILAALILGIVPTSLSGKTKGLNACLVITPTVLFVAGVFVMVLDPWWNQQLSKHLHPSFPSLGLLLLISNGSMLLSHLSWILFGQKLGLIRGGAGHAKVK